MFERFPSYVLFAGLPPKGWLGSLSKGHQISGVKALVAHQNDFHLVIGFPRALTPLGPSRLSVNADQPLPWTLIGIRTYIWEYLMDACGGI